MDLVYTGDPGDFTCWQVSDSPLPGLFLLNEHLLDDPPERLTPPVLTTFFPTFVSSKLPLVHVRKHRGIFNTLKRVTHLPLDFKYSSLPLLSPSSHSCPQSIHHGWTPWDIFCLFVCFTESTLSSTHQLPPVYCLSHPSWISLIIYLSTTAQGSDWPAHHSILQIWKLRVNFLNLVTWSLLGIFICRWLCGGDEAFLSFVKTG